MTLAGVAAVGVVVLVAVGGCGSDPADIVASDGTGAPLSVDEREDIISADLQCEPDEQVSHIQLHRIPLPPDFKGDESVRTAEAAANRFLAWTTPEGRPEPLGPRNEAVRDGVVLFDTSETATYLVRFADGEKRSQYLFGEEADDVWIFLGGGACTTPSDDVNS